jgi:hypothetical protein
VTVVVAVTSTTALLSAIDSTAAAVAVASVVTFDSLATAAKSPAWPSNSFLKSPVEHSMIR